MAKGFPHQIHRGTTKKYDFESLAGVNILLVFLPYINSTPTFPLSHLLSFSGHLLINTLLC